MCFHLLFYVYPSELFAGELHYCSLDLQPSTSLPPPHSHAISLVQIVSSTSTQGLQSQVFRSQIIPTQTCSDPNAPVDHCDLGLHLRYPPPQVLWFWRFVPVLLLLLLKCFLYRSRASSLLLSTFRKLTLPTTS